MQYIIVHEWNVQAFFEFFFSFSSFLVLTNAKCKCHDWSYQCVMQPLCPKYAIDRLLTTDLDVNPLWMQTKHDVNLDFFISDANAFWQGCKCNFHDADVPCRDGDTRFIHDDASTCIQNTMQMSPCRDGDVNVF